MPYKCCVPGCRGNFNNGPKVKVFSFPSQTDLRAEWIDSIKKKNFEPSKHSRVCELHFLESDIQKEASMLDSKTGKIVSAPLCRPKLSKNAVPQIFPVVLPNTTRKKKKEDSMSAKSPEPSLSNQDNNATNNGNEDSMDSKDTSIDLVDDDVEKEQTSPCSYTSSPENNVILSASQAFLDAIEALEKRASVLEEDLRKLSSSIS